VCADPRAVGKGEKWGGTVEAGLGARLRAIAVNHKLNNSEFNVVCPEKTEPGMGEPPYFVWAFRPLEVA
jgi:hypothetical protein